MNDQVEFDALAWFSWQGKARFSPGGCQVPNPVLANSSRQPRSFSPPEELLPPLLLIAGWPRPGNLPSTDSSGARRSSLSHSVFLLLKFIQRDLGFLLKKEEKDFVKRPEEEKIKSWPRKKVSKR